jgi:hypothetical protein
MTTYTTQSVAYDVDLQADAADAATLTGHQARRLTVTGMSRADVARRRAYGVRSRDSLTIAVDPAAAAARLAALRARRQDAAARVATLRAAQDAATADAADARGVDPVDVVAAAAATLRGYDFCWRRDPADAGRAYVAVPRRDVAAPPTARLRSRGRA